MTPGSAGSGAADGQRKARWRAALASPVTPQSGRGGEYVASDGWSAGPVSTRRSPLLLDAFEAAAEGGGGGGAEARRSPFSASRPPQPQPPPLPLPTLTPSW